MIRTWMFAAALVLGACASESPSVEPYDGEPAFPSQRQGYAPEGRLLGYIANRSSDSVSVIDLDRMEVLGEAPLGRDPVDVDGPRRVVLDRTRGIGYVALSYPDAIVSPHASTNSAIDKAGYVQAFSLFDLAPLGELRVPPSATDIALSSDGNLLLVSHYDNARSLLMTELEKRRATLDLIEPAWALPERAAKLRSVTLCVVPAAIVYDEKRSRAFVACAGEDSLAVVDTQNASILGYVPAGEGTTNKPYALVPDPAGERLALSNQVASSVVVFDMQDAPAILFSVYFADGVPFYAGWLSNDAFLVPIQGPSGLALVDAASGMITARVALDESVCLGPSEVSVSRSGRIFVVCDQNRFKPGRIAELDPESLEVLATVDVGIYPDRLALLEP